MKKFLKGFVVGFLIGYGVMFAYYLLDNARLENKLLQREISAYEDSNV